MKTRFDNREIPHLWAHQTQEKAYGGGNIYFEGQTIYSYGRHFPIATFVENAAGERAVLFTTGSCSITTSHHCGMVWAAIPAGIPVFDVALEYRYGGQEPANYVAGYRGRIALQEKAVAKANKRNQPDKYAALVALVAQANQFAEFFGLPERFDAQQDFDVLKAELSAAEARERAERKAQLERLEAEQREKIEQWLAGEQVYLPYNLPRVYLRVEGEEIVTSKGARFPIAHARTGLKLVQQVMRDGKKWKTNGHTLHLGHYAVDRIEPDGTVYAGCHVVQYPEIERIAAQI